MTYATTIIKVSVHLPDDSPIFGESSTHISLEDEAGGIYLKLQQCTDVTENGAITFNDIEHMTAVFHAAKLLLDYEVDTAEEQKPAPPAACNIPPPPPGPTTKWIDF